MPTDQEKQFDAFYREMWTLDTELRAWKTVAVVLSSTNNSPRREQQIREAKQKVIELNAKLDAVMDQTLRIFIQLPQFHPYLPLIQRPS
jgi:hypothetical protein